MPAKHTLMREDVSLVSSRIYGAARTAGTITTALAAIGGARAVLLLCDEDDGVWTLNSNVVVPSNVNLLIPTHVTVGGSGNLTLNGRLFAERDDWYVGTGVLTISTLKSQMSGLLLEALETQTLTPLEALNVQGGLFFPTQDSGTPFHQVTPVSGVVTLPDTGMFFEVIGVQTVREIISTNNVNRLVVLLFTGGAIQGVVGGSDNLQLIGLDPAPLSSMSVFGFLCTLREGVIPIWQEIWRVPAMAPNNFRFAQPNLIEQAVGSITVAPNTAVEIINITLEVVAFALITFICSINVQSSASGTMSGQVQLRYGSPTGTIFASLAFTNTAPLVLPVTVLGLSGPQTGGMQTYYVTLSVDLGSVAVDGAQAKILAVQHIGHF
jgi:hypothetical protein